MGFFKTLFGRDWRKFKARGDDHLKDEEWGRARGAFQEALRLFDGQEAERATVEAQLAVANERLLRMHLGEAERFIDQDMMEKAAEHLQTALDFVSGAEQREDVLARISRLGASLAPDPAMAPQDESVGLDDPFDEVETFLVHLSNLSPEQADAYETFGEGFRKAYLAMMSGQWEQAEALLMPIYERDSDNTFLQYELGRLRLGQERFAEAEALLSQACEKSPDSIPMRHDRIRALWQLEDFATAERMVEAAFEIDDELLDNFAIAGETCLRSGEYENGVEIVEAGIALYGQSIALHRLLGKLEGARKNHRSALDAFETALRLRWRFDYETGQLNFDIESAWLAANLYLATRINLPRAEELFRAMLASSDEGGRLAYLVGAGQAMMLQGDKKGARDFLVEAASMAPEGSEVLDRIKAIMEGEQPPGDGA